VFVDTREHGQLCASPDQSQCRTNPCRQTCFRARNG
jgi:hypothetical protein